MKVTDILTKRTIAESKDFDDIEFKTPEEEIAYIDHRIAYINQYGRERREYADEMCRKGKLSNQVTPSHTLMVWVIGSGQSNKNMYVQDNAEGRRIQHRVAFQSTKQNELDKEMRSLRAARTRAEKQLARLSFKDNKGLDQSEMIPEAEVPRKLQLDNGGFSFIHNPYYKFEGKEGVTHYAGDPDKFTWGDHKLYAFEYKKLKAALERTKYGGFSVMYASSHEGKTVFAVVGAQGYFVFENDSQFPKAIIHIRSVRTVPSDKFAKMSDREQDLDLQRYYHNFFHNMKTK